MALPRSDEEATSLVLKRFDEARKTHDFFVDRCEKRYRSYRAIAKPGKSKVARWRNQVKAPYVFQIVETLVANLIDEKPKFSVRPRPKLADLNHLASLRLQAKTMENLLRYEQELDHYAEKKRPLALQGAITGLTVAKCYWDEAERPSKRLVSRSRPVLDEYDEPTGIEVPYLEEVDVIDYRDGPTFEVVDVRDFLWPESAVSLDRADYVFHRVWMSFEEVVDRYGEDKAEPLKESRDFGDIHEEREADLFHVQRNRDMIEVLEYWHHDGEVLALGNRKSLLERKQDVFWHGRFPFVATSSIPDLFRIPGISEVEIMEALQEMLWSLQNQRLDSLELLNNAIVLASADYDDIDNFEFAPGAVNTVDRADQVVIWQPSMDTARVSLEAEQMLKGDMQNTTGGMPFVAGMGEQMDQDTATGVSIITNLAQRRLQAKRANYVWMEKRIGQQWISLCQQFIRAPRVVEIAGPAADMTWVGVGPEEIQGSFSFEVAASTESLMRQERRAEAQALLNVFAGAAQVMTMHGAPPNLRAFAEQVLDAYDIDDKDRFFLTPPPMPGAPPGLAPGMTPPAGEAEGEPAQPGVTNPELAAGPLAPSNQASLSAGAMGQQFLTETGPVS